MAVFLGTLIVGNALIAPDKAVKARMLGQDFIAFYTGGTFVREGRRSLLYDLGAVRGFQHHLAGPLGIDLGDNFGPFWNPPFYAWVFAPLSALSFPAALGVWTILSLSALAAALVLLARMLPSRVGGSEEKPIGWREWGLVPALVLVSMPFLQAVSHGQNTFSSLLLLALTVTAWRGGHALRAGLVAGLLFYKPQVGTVLAVVLALNLGWRALVGIAVTGSALLLVNLLTLPGTLGDYLHRLPENVHYMQVEHTYLWERHATFKGFWRLLLQGRGPGEAALAARTLTAACCAALGGGVLAAAWRWRRATGPRRDRLIAATVAAMPLLMPFYFDYDLLLLAVPAVLLAGEWLAGNPAEPRRPADRWLIRAWVALFAWLFVNSALASRTRVNLTVALVTVIAGLLVRRAWRREGEKSALPEMGAPPLLARHAA